MSSAVSASPPVADPLSVEDGYERWAPLYDRGPNPLLAREERYLLPIVANLSGKHLLDLACGTGRWIEKLLSQGRHSGVGLDYSAAMLRVASAKQGIRDRLARACCESLPFRSATFDLALCSFALSHIEDLATIVRELARVTEDGADVFVSDLHPEAYTLGWRVGFRDHAGASQIAMIPRQAKEISHAFSVGGFECDACESLSLGEPERPLFENAGKAHSFAEACRVPAVLVYRFKRVSSVGGKRPSQLAETNP